LTEESIVRTDSIYTRNIFHEELDLNNLTEEIYYSVNSVDKNNNNSYISKPIKLKKPDHIPPVAAVFTNESIEYGKFHLSWIPSSSKDFRMFEIYRHDVKMKDSILLLTSDSLSINQYIDSNFSMGLSYQYSIKSIDDDGNSSRAISGVLSYESNYRNIGINLDHKVDRVKRTINLKWSHNNKYKPAKYFLYRSIANSDSPIFLETLDGNSTTYIDKNLEIGNVYSYKIQADLGNNLESNFSKIIKILF
jgi:uncharacterized protein